MAVITISREFGSGGDAVASRLCEALGYHSFGKAQILEAAQETTYAKWNAIDYSEDNHEVQSVLDRLFRSTASPVQKIAWSEDPSIASRPERADVTDAAVLSLVKRAIKAAPRQDNMVIVGRGGQVLLKDTPGVIHVRIEAPVETRARNIMEELKREQGSGREQDRGSEDALLRAAKEILATRDKSSADYIQRYYYVNWADPRLYHMVLNLGLLSVEQAVQVIMAVVQSLKEPAAGAEG